jgi:hypothetical protein
MKQNINEIKRMQQLAGIIEEGEDANSTEVKVVKVKWADKDNPLATPEGLVVKSKNEINPFLVFINRGKMYYAHNLNTDQLVELNPNDIQVIKDYPISNDEDSYAVQLFNDKLAKGDIANGIASIT